MKDWILKLSLIFMLSIAVGACAMAQPGQQGDGIWIRNAAFGESQTFDACNGHQPQSGEYHHHIQPICLRAQLNDNLVVAKTGRTGTFYREKSTPFTHSPILGWAFDGYPIYGPYGYSDATNANSAIKRMQSGFRLRSITDRTSLPSWALANHPNVPQQLSATQQGPPITDAYPLGRYVEDFEFVQGLGDLDVYNGRFAVTPEFPNGTYAYYVTIDQNGSPVFPYFIGMQYYGAVAGGRAQNVPATAQEYFANGQTVQNAPALPLLNAWFTKNSQQSARAVSGFDPSAGSQTTWPNDAPAAAQVNGGVRTPALADTQRIRFSDTTVYVNSNNLASYTMGPWFDQTFPGGVFGNWAAAQTFQMQIPRTPSAATTKQNTGLGAVGLWVNGVAAFNVLDGATYSNTAKADAGGGRVVSSAIHVSSASFEGGPTSPGALMTAFPLFGAKLATTTAATDSFVWPFTLGGATVAVRDAAGATLPAAISYASPGQLNYRIPETAALGLGMVTITANGATATGNINIVAAYPNIFQFNGEGLAAAQILRVRNGQQTYEPIFQIVGSAVTALPIDLGPATDELYLILYGTGLGKNNPTVSAKIGGTDSFVAYAGAQGTYTGLDQFNLLLPRSLAGKGKADVIITANGKTSNLVNITIK